MTIPKFIDYRMPLKTSFPQNRAAWQLAPQRAVLLLHDVQSYFLGFYAPDSKLIEQLKLNLVTLRDWAHNNDVPVIYTAQPHQQAARERMLLNDIWGSGLSSADPALQKIIPELAPTQSDTIFVKWRYSAFQRSDLLEYMRNRQKDQLVIGGVYASIGCMVTAIDAFMYDIQAFMVGDAVADFSEDDHRMALNYVAGRCGVVIDTEALVGARTILPDHDWLQQRVLQFIEDETEIDNSENLIFYGLDSLKVMRLAAELKNFNISFEELAREPTINAWAALIKQKSQRIVSTQGTHE